jgi:uncharacterized repeat protein (TIGR04052 family)
MRSSCSGLALGFVSALTLGAAGCGGGAASGTTYSVNFVPLVGGAPFACGQTYANIGTTQSTIQPQDFRMYVSGVNLVRAGGEQVPLALKNDNTWQGDDIALLDFEDGTGGCNTASPEMNTKVVGTAAAHDDYTSVQFTVGLPQDHDHLAAATAAAPLNQPAMWWSWLGGYRYLKVDVQTTANPSYFFHLGAMTCSGGSMTTIDCKYHNLATITLPFAGSSASVALDLATLFADSNVDLQPDGVTTFNPGCMSLEGDPQCPAPYATLGLSFQDAGTPPAQTFFAAH